MSDLINRKALLEDFRKTITEQSDTIDWLNLINNQPTAYDVDKVVEKLENEPSCGFGFKGLYTKRAVEIVKEGAVKDE